MKRKLLSAALLAVSALGFEANAQTDVTSSYLVNPSFEEDAVGAVNSVTGWTVSSNENWNGDGSFSNLSIGSKDACNGQAFGIPTPSDGNKYLFNRKGWLAGKSTDFSFSTTTKTEVPVGKYYLVFDYKAADCSNNNNAANNGTTLGIFVTDAQSQTLAAVTPVLSALSEANAGGNPPTSTSYFTEAAWSSKGIYFEVKENSTLTFTVQQILRNSGRSDVVYDNFRLYEISSATELDMTGMIVNPAVEPRNSNGWTIYKNENVGNGPLKDNNKFEYWSDNKEKRGFDYYQIISGVPVGKYTLSADLRHTQSDSDSSDPSCGLYISNTSGDTKYKLVEIGSDDNAALTKYTTDEIVVMDGTIRIGIKNFEVMNAKWFLADNFALTFTGELGLSDYLSLYDTVLERAKAIDQNKTMAPSIKSALQSAIDADATLNKESIEDIKAATETLSSVTDKANTSVASYETIASGTVRTDVLDGWSCTNGNIFHINDWSDEGNSDGSGMTTPFIENWTGSGYLDEGVFSYTIECLEPGEVYYAQALIRAYNERNTDVPNGPKFFINETETDLVSEGTPFTYKGMSGIYATLGAFATVREDGTLTLGAKIESGTNYNWVAFKNVSIQTASAAYASAKANAEAVDVTQPMNSDVRSAYNSTFATYGTEPSSTQEYETAIQALNDAAAAANASITAYSKMKGELDRVYNEVSTTNVYTADAYKANYTDKLEAWTNETISTEEASAYTFGSRVTGAGPAILLSPWAIGETTAVEDGSLYINTWSDEGDKDGSNFKTPFFEYYTDANKNLETKTFTATVPVENGFYKVSIWARAQSRSDAAMGEWSKTALTINVNGGESVSLVNLDNKVGDFYIGTFEAEGEVTDGNLVVTINVVNPSNCHWLSFRDLNYSKIEEVSVEMSEIGYATFSSEYPLDLSSIDGGTAYIVTDDAVEGNYIKLTEQTEAVPANTGLIIAGEEGTVTIPVVATANPLDNKNYLVAGTGAAAPQGSYVLSCKKGADGEGYNLETVGFYAVDADQPLVAKGKAYLELPAKADGLAKALYFVFGNGTATAIETAEAADADADSDGAIYNVAGQQVGKDYKGIVIKNGKKYLNK